MEVNDQENTPYITVSPSSTQAQKVEALIEGIEKLKKKLNIPNSIKEWGVDEDVVPRCSG